MVSCDFCLGKQKIVPSRALGGFIGQSARNLGEDGVVLWSERIAVPLRGVLDLQVLGFMVPRFPFGSGVPEP